MRLIQVDTSTPPHYVLESKWYERSAAQAAKLRWNAIQKHWWTSDKFKAARLWRYAEEPLRGELRQLCPPGYEII